jgi:hypothetical protein
MKFILAASLALALATPVFAADGDQATMPAVPTATATMTARAQPVAAEIFRPAPMPNENATPWREASSTDEASLHPDLLRMREQHAGVLGDTSAEYERTSRVAPAGGMSLSIPVQ